MRTIDVLYFDGCPNVDVTIARVRAAVAASGQDVEVKLTRIETEAQAAEPRFLGSPTVRVDDVDVEPRAGRTAVEPAGGGAHCRVYEVEGRLVGAPPEEWIRAALVEGPRR